MERSSAWEGARCVQGTRLALRLKTYGDRRSAPGLQTHIQTCSMWTTDTRQGQQQDPKFSRADPTPSKYLAIFQVNTKRQLNLERFTDANGTQLEYIEDKGQRDHLGARSSWEDRPPSRQEEQTPALGAWQHSRNGPARARGRESALAEAHREQRSKLCRSQARPT